MGSFGRNRLLSMLVRCTIRDGKIQRLAFVPGVIEGHGPPTFVKPADGEEVVRHMERISAAFGTRFEVGPDDVNVVLDSR